LRPVRPSESPLRRSRLLRAGLRARLRIDLRPGCLRARWLRLQQVSLADETLDPGRMPLGSSLLQINKRPVRTSDGPLDAFLPGLAGVLLRLVTPSVDRRVATRFMVGLRPTLQPARVFRRLVTPSVDRRGYSGKSFVDK
jgi:hypothetical protein